MGGMTMGVGRGAQHDEWHGDMCWAWRAMSMMCGMLMGAEMETGGWLQNGCVGALCEQSSGPRLRVWCALSR
eukprot:scaffold145801_cov19-Tisochrysis_lutea.AAC.2